MTAWLLLVLAWVRSIQNDDAATLALRVTTVEDALVTLPAASSPRMVLVGDVDGDGHDEVAFEHWEELRCWIDLVSVCDGSVTRRLWGRTSVGPRTERWSWDAGDVDADGVADLILGLPTHDAAGVDAGVVVIVSGADARVLRRVLGSRDGEAFGTCVSFLGDLDGDGLGDYAVGAREYADPPPPTSSGCTAPVHLSGGASQAVGPGFVSARSGRDDAELWRAVGERTGQGFGSRLRRLADLERDGIGEVLVQSRQVWRDRTLVLCGAQGAVVRDLGTDLGRGSSAGDFDGDGRGDLALEVEHLSNGKDERGAASRVVSGASWREIVTLQHPDFFPWEGVTESVGDLDGDAHDELAVTEAGYQPSPRAFLDPTTGKQDLRAHTFGELLASGPVGNSSARGGCVWIVSGRTRLPIWVVHGASDSGEWLGRAVCAVPDVSGDGRPDLIVSGRKASYLFEGPGE